jgi:glucosylceramidase
MKPSRSIQLLIALLLFHSITSSSGCKKTKTDLPTENNGKAEAWVTTTDQIKLLEKQPELGFGKQANSYLTIDVDSTQTFQSVDGFGYCLTGGSAFLINKLPASQKADLLNELFGSSATSLNVSYLRVSIGASDLDSVVFSYDDVPAGQTDVNLSQFSLAPDKANLIPVLKQILTINPTIKILGSPWSPPVWMKDNGNSKGGSLKPEYYPVYAQYFVKYIQGMKAEGITIDAITPQNEPLHPGNNPSMYMTPEQQRDFIKTALGPAFKAAAITTRIIVYDHNANRPDYPITILNDPEAKQYVDGSAFHLYEGDVSALSQVHNAHPDKNLYFTEQWTGANGTFSGDLKWHIKNIIIGTMRNWSRNALEWNLANDPDYKPHTPGGCTECKGALTIGFGINRNVSYYIIGHASKFVPPGSVRIQSSQPSGLATVAFRRPDGKKALIVLNEGSSSTTFNIKQAGSWTTMALAAGAVATVVW